MDIIVIQVAKEFDAELIRFDNDIMKKAKTILRLRKK
jgi:hypothetical protein